MTKVIFPALTILLALVIHVTSAGRQQDASCQPGLLLKSGDILVDGNIVENSEFDVNLKQQGDGNLVLRKNSNGETLWASRLVQGNGNYWTKLQKDGNLITRRGKPTDSPIAFSSWKTDSDGINGDYFLAINCNGESISTYPGSTPDRQRGDAIWTNFFRNTCAPGFLMSTGYFFRAGAILQNYEFMAYLSQEENGNLILRRGAFYQDPGVVLWESGFEGATDGDYWTKLQRDGNLVTREGEIQDHPPKDATRWKSNSNRKTGLYFLALDCDGEGMSIYEGTEDTRGNPIWTADFTCEPGALIQSGDVLSVDDFFLNKEFNAYITQQDDGNLVVFRGTPENRGDVLWESGYIGNNDKYWSELQEDGNLVTREGNPTDSSIGSTVWASDSTMSIADYLLALNCDGETISIYQGTRDDRGDAIWTDILSPPSCELGILMNRGDLLQVDEHFQNVEYNAFITQRSDGNLVLIRGTTENPGEVLWASGVQSTEGDFFTKLQGNGDLVTKQGTPSSPSRTVWQTGKWVSGPFLALNSDRESMSIYGNEGAVWTVFFRTAFCQPGSLMRSGDILQVNEVLKNEDFNAYITQQSDGNLVVFRGTPESPGNVLWASGVESTNGDFSTKLQADGNLITRSGNLTPTTVWKSDSDGEHGDYFLGVDCDGESVSIYQGLPGQRQKQVWTSER